MRAAILLVALVSCTKPNPDLCCNDAEDCRIHDIPDGQGCDDGLVCRGNRCILQTCQRAGHCDATLPYCNVGDVDGVCASTCSADTECPGYAQTLDQQYCVEGVCVQCRSMADCMTDAPICDVGACRQCRAHDECVSGVCDDGVCIAPEQVAYISPTGAESVEVETCPSMAPCTPRWAQIIRPHPHYFVFEPGSYSGVEFKGSFDALFVGRGRPQLGPIQVSELGASKVRIEQVDTSTIACYSRAHIILRGVHANYAATDATLVMTNESCSFDAYESTFTGGIDGLELRGLATLDRCQISGASGAGLRLYKQFELMNTFVTHNGTGIVFAPGPTGKAAFLTIVDNGAIGAQCDNNTTGVPPLQFANSIIGRNGGVETSGADCDFSTSLVLESGLGVLNFKSPDVAPFDYHITAGSAAIDAATGTSTLDHDFDGDLRPTGAARDLGADEFKP